MTLSICTKRLDAKSIGGLFCSHLQNRYRLPPIAAETLGKDAVIWRDLLCPESRRDGQIIYHAVKLGQPASKKIKDCEMVKVKLTLFDHEDIQVLKLKGGQAYTIKVLIRIAREAIEQGGVLSNEDIQFLLRLSPRTIVRYKHMILQKGERIILRGDSQDMGPGKSHRIQIISLFLQGYSETEISQRMNHTLESVEMYVYDFLRVSLMYRDGYEPGIIARVAKLSKGKIYAVLELYEHFSKDDFYSSSLDNVLEIFELKRQFKKGGALI